MSSAGHMTYIKETAIANTLSLYLIVQITRERLAESVAKIKSRNITATWSLQRVLKIH